MCFLARFWNQYECWGEHAEVTILVLILLLDTLLSVNQYIMVIGYNRWTQPTVSGGYGFAGYTSVFSIRMNSQSGWLKIPKVGRMKTSNSMFG